MRNPIDYAHIFKDSRTIFSMDDSPREINVFLPVRKRLTFLAPCLAYLNRASEEAGIKVIVTVIENDDSPLYKEYCKQAGISYIFIPTSISCSDGMFAKALCYNIGFLSTRMTEWNVFHDLDILVDKNFFKNLSTYLSEKTTWVQPYTKRRVIRLDAISTNTIVRNPEESFDLSGLGTPSSPGSPGGSIVVRSSDFIKVGGYDPEYFYGYSPEDSFFWAKLEVLYKEISEPFINHMQGSAVYADDPAIDVYHLDHPLAAGSNSKLNLMLSYQQAYYRSSYARKKHYIDTKSEHFTSAMIG